MGRSFAPIESLESRTMLANAVPVLINAGGAQFADSIGRTFQADADFSGGQVGQSSPYDVQNTPDDSLFTAWREGASFSYAIPVTNGHYSLTLEFADPVFAAAGQRTFNVTAEAAPILNGFDIAASAGGSGIAVAKSFDVNVTDGTLNLSFTGVVNNALISAIALVPTDVPTEAAPYSWLALSDPARVTLSLSNLANIGSFMEFYANENKGKFPPDFPTLLTTQGAPDYLFANPRTSTQLPRGERSDLESVAWIAARQDYIYLGAGKKASGPADAVLAYENPNRENGDIGILYGDGHAGTLDRASAAALIGFAKTPPSDPPPTPPSVGPADPNVLASQQNLRTLSTALLNYSNNNKGRFPVDLGTLYDQNYVTDLHVFANPRGTTQLPPDSASKADKVAWIDASSDYLYGAAGQRTSAFSSLQILISENPAQMTGGLDQLFGDGHTEFRETRWANESLRRRRPKVLSASYNYNAAPPFINFNFDVAGIAASSAQGSDMSLLNLDTNQPVPSSSITVSYDAANRNLKFALPGSFITSLPDGHYRATLAAGSVADAFGNALDAAASSDFVLLTGDANSDHHVDATDFTAMAQNFNGVGVSVAQGDFNYDGVVNAIDFNLLATRFGTQLAAPVVAGASLFANAFRAQGVIVSSATTANASASGVFNSAQANLFAASSISFDAIHDLDDRAGSGIL